MGTYDYDVIVVGGGPAGASAAKAAVEGGLSTLLIEKNKMPRHKECSGLILPAAHLLVENYFGPIPAEVRAEPHTYECSRWYMPGGRVFDFKVTQINIWRDKFDQWLCNESGAEIWDETKLIDFAEWKDRVELTCRRDGEQLRLSSPVMIAADGGLSNVVKRVDPTFEEGLSCNYYQQDFHRCDVDLEPEYGLHMFLEPGLGLYPCAQIKDDLLLIVVGVLVGEKINPVREKLVEWLGDNFGFKSYELVMTMGCRALGAAPANRFCFGTDRVLVVGEAAGFLNNGAEGISSALATGNIAGHAAVETADLPPGPVYRENVKPERERTVKEWFMPATMTGRAVPEFRESLMALPPIDRMRASWHIFAWLNRMGNYLHDQFELSVRRLLHGDFDFRA